MGKSLKLAKPRFSLKTTDNNKSPYLVGPLEAVQGTMVPSSEHMRVNSGYTTMEGSLHLISIHLPDQVIQKLHRIFNDLGCHTEDVQGVGKISSSQGRERTHRLGAEDITLSCWKGRLT